MRISAVAARRTGQANGLAGRRETIGQRFEAETPSIPGVALPGASTPVSAEERQVDKYQTVAFLTTTATGVPRQWAFSGRLR